MALLEKDSVNRIELYDSQERHMGTTKLFTFGKSPLFKSHIIPITIKSASLPAIAKGEQLMLVFEYSNGNRYRTVVGVEEATKTEVQVTVTDVTEIEERRQYFKVKCNHPCLFNRSVVSNDEPDEGTILNINLGGILLQTKVMLIVGGVYTVTFLNGRLTLKTKILRKQVDKFTNELIGYGCQFQEVTPAQEAALQKFIMDCQQAERERLKKQEEFMEE